MKYDKKNKKIKLKLSIKQLCLLDRVVSVASKKDDPQRGSLLKLEFKIRDLLIDNAEAAHTGQS